MLAIVALGSWEPVVVHWQPKADLVDFCLQECPALFRTVGHLSNDVESSVEDGHLHPSIHCDYSHALARYLVTIPVQ